jgi:hypothetical protein
LPKTGNIRSPWCYDCAAGFTTGREHFLLFLDWLLRAIIERLAPKLGA